MAVYSLKFLKILFLLIVFSIGVLCLLGLFFQQNALKTFHKNNKFFVIDTIGCQVPYYRVIELKENEYSDFSCGKDLLRSSDFGSELLLNLNDSELMGKYKIKPAQLEMIDCFYTEIKRVDDYHNTYHNPTPFLLKKGVPVRIDPGIEFIRVLCGNSKPKIWFKGFYFFPVNKTNIKMPVVSKCTEDSPDRISVMIFGIDTFSHIHFLRIFSRTKNYIENNLPHVEYWGYNKVGDNTFPNLMALLGKYNADELERGCMINKMFDNCTFVWDEYKKFNYTTVYAEDNWSSSVFDYKLNGFSRQPTDYVLNPLIKEMQDHVSHKSTGDFQLCYGGRKSFNILPEHIRKLTPTYLTQDFFSFYWSASYSHDKPLLPKVIENNFIDMLDNMHKSGLLNKTFLFFLSDHGFRWGRGTSSYEGFMEGNQPLLIAIYPKWFGEKYSSAISNLALNARRLSTPFDVHESLMDLANLTLVTNQAITERTSQLKEVKVLPRGISLFLPIPEYRTCDHADIAAHWCNCYQRQMLPNNDPRAQQVSKFTLDEVNKILRPYLQCALLELHSITDCFIAVPNKRFVKNYGNYDYGVEITVRIVTVPGYAEFESTVHILHEKLILTGTITRTNSYGNQSYCVDEAKLKLYCYCTKVLRSIDNY